jgi:FixJ family two-component response regulator
MFIELHIAKQMVSSSHKSEPKADLSPSVAIIDDDPTVLRSIARLLATNGFAPSTYSAAGAFLTAFEDLRPTCIITDLSMPEITGINLQRQVVNADPNVSIVFISAKRDIDSSLQAMRSGAVDFLLKPFSPRDLLEAVQRAHKSTLRRRTKAKLVESILERLGSLTPREREVFSYVVEGYLNKQIASELRIAEKTVKVHRARVMNKMRVRSVAKLARLAEQVAASDAMPKIDQPRAESDKQHSNQ